MSSGLRPRPLSRRTLLTTAMRARSVAGIGVLAACGQTNTASSGTATAASSPATTSAASSVAPSTASATTSSATLSSAGTTGSSSVVATTGLKG